MIIFLGPWYSGAYFSALDVDDYLDEYSADENSYNLNNQWIYNETDLTEYLIIYTFNINSGVLSKAEIKDDSDTVLYRFSIQTNTNGQIPFTNYFLIFTLSTIVLIGALITKKIKIKST
jgi:NADH:ubiquinone oxidoreductase subunit 6 (subunit J)